MQAMVVTCLFIFVLRHGGLTLGAATPKQPCLPPAPLRCDGWPVVPPLWRPLERQLSGDRSELASLAVAGKTGGQVDDIGTLLSPQNGC
jgi:hypothetical protein